MKKGKSYYQETLPLKISNLQHQHFEKDDDDGDDAGDGDDDDGYDDDGHDSDDDDDCEEFCCTDRCQTRFAQWEKERVWISAFLI